MAQKTYTMDFVLNAVLNGGFNGVFSQAQQKFVQLGTEIKTVQSIQRDITSYQKQAQAVTNTTNKLQHLQSQQAKVREQIEALKSIQAQDSDEKARNRAQVAQLEREYDKYQQKIETTQAAMDRQRQKMEELGGKLQEAGVDTSALGEKSAELTERLKGMEAEQKKVNEELANGGSQAQEFGEKGGAALEAVGSALAAAGVAVALKEIADGFVACVDAAAEFGSAMSAVEAISDANEREMAELNQKAKETGLTTVYTAQQSANAMEYMAMAGWEAQDMLSGMSGMVNLAAAAGEDLAGVSDIVTDNLTAFGMEANETTHFADVLAQAAANSNTNIQKMGESFKNSSAVAGALGYSVEDVAVALGLMANSAVKGTRAGTALRNIFNGFVEGMTLTGQSFDEVEVSAINADGSIKGFMETIRELRGYFSQMTGAEKIQNANEIAGLRGYNGLLAMVNATDADFEKLYENINNCEGAAQRMAKVKLDNMKGDLTIAKSAWEGMTIAIGEQFEPELRNLYRTGEDVFNQVSGFVEANPDIVKLLAGAAAGVGAVTAAMTGYAAISKVVAALGIAGPFGMGAGAALLLAAGLGAVTAAGISWAAQAGELTKETRAAMEALEEARESFGETAEDTLATAAAAENYVDKLEALEAQGKKSDEANSEYQTTMGLLLQTMPELESSLEKNVDQYGRVTYAVEGSTQALRDNIQAMKDQAMEAALQEYRETAYKAQADILVEEQKNRIKLADAIEKQTAAEEEYERVRKRIDELVAEHQKDYETARETYLNGGAYDPILEADVTQTPGYLALVDDLSQASQEVANAQEVVDRLNSAIDTNQEKANEARKEVDLVERTIQAWAEETQAQRDAAQAAKDYTQAVEEQVGPAGDAAAEMAQGVTDNLDQSAAAKEAGEDTGESYLMGLKAAMEEKNVEEAMAAMRQAMSRAMGTTFGAVIGNFEDPVKSGDAGTTIPEVRLGQKQPLMQGVYSDWDRTSHYAQGTENATPGWAVVGEEGPELVRLRGGEAVFPAAKTAQMLSGGGGGGYGPVTLYLTVQGSVDDGTVQDIKGAVKDALAEIEEDRRRRGYT